MPGYELPRVELKQGVYQYSVLRDGHAVSLRGVLAAMQDEPGFRDALTEAVTACGFDAARFETPGATTSTLDSPFEFVLVSSPGLVRTPDASSFAKQFRAGDPDEPVLVFPNLSGDATMVVPRPITGNDFYTHLLDFLRHAPKVQIHALWSAAGGAMLERVGSAPLWLSTAGGGVPWLHVRIDQRPKYYSHQAYTTAL